MNYREDLLSKQLYELNTEAIIRKFNPKYIEKKSMLENIYCLFWKVRQYLSRWKYKNLVDEENILSLDEMRYMEEKSNIKLGEIPKVAVYTCIISNYDKLLEPLYKSGYCDYYAVTDFAYDSNSAWKRINSRYFPDAYKHSKKGPYVNRWFKMHPHELFPNYEYSLYVDGSVLIVADVIPLLLKMMKNNSFLGIHKHSKRSNMETEARVLIKNNKVKNIELLNKQLLAYRNDGFNNNIPLLEATIILRKHNEHICKHIMNEWWSEFLMYVPRDQISLPYVLWKNGVSVDDITILGENEYMNPRFSIRNHYRK